jgi:ribosome maturation factor RimP
MADKAEVERIVREFIAEKGLFLVGIKISASNRITVLADTMDGIKIDECVALHRYIEKNLDRDREDYELQVSSPGLDMPFAVIQQYNKNEGRLVEVTGTDGNKLTGLLKNVTAGGFEIETEIKEKGKVKVIREVSFNYDQVKSTRALYTIK